MWTTADAKRFNKSIKTRKDARMWVAVANSSLKTCMAKGGVESECAASAITQANGVLKRRKEKENAMAKSQETKTKMLNGKAYPKSSFLIVGDQNNPATWVLPVESPDGKLDNRMMNAAWAMLHQGYRGKVYEGAGKAEAIQKLKAAYDSAKFEIPADTAEVETVAEYMDGEMDYYIPSTIVSFDQLDALQDTQEKLHELYELTGVFTKMVNNIVYWFEGDKVEQLRIIMDEYIKRLDELMRDGATDEDDSTPTTGEEVSEFAETASGDIILAETDGANSVLTMDVVIIKPGWGNKVDNHYYPSEMLRRDANKFSGAKMYETDHRDDEKSTRTWVSTITDMIGFDDFGSPIARVKVHDPGFAERVRNLNALGLLDKMECSIFATGKAAVGFEQDGRKGKKVTELIDVHSVDWVTRAGAGGKALSLVENQEGGSTMPKEENENQVGNSENNQEQTTETVPVNEQAHTENVSAQPEQEAVENSAPAEPVYLDQATVEGVLAKSSLIEAGKFRLAQGKYLDEAQLQAAIDTEIEYLTQALGAGKPFGMGEKSTPPKDQTEVESAVTEAAHRVNQKYFSNVRLGG